MGIEMHLAVRRRLVPTTLAIAMLGFVVAASLAPDTGIVAADSNCPYGNCNPAPAPFWQTTTGYATIGGIVAVIVAAALLGLYFVRRRGGGSGGAPPGSARDTGGEAPPEEAPEAVESPPEGPGGGESPPSAEETPPWSEEPESETGDINGLMKEIDKLTKEE